jgi:cytochrome c
MLTRSLTRFRALGHSVMLASFGVLATPLPVNAKGDAAAGEKGLRPLRPVPFEQAGRKQIRTVISRRVRPQERDGARLYYSAAMKVANVTWDEKTLDEYLQGPGKFVKGTRTVYFVPNEKDRQDVIAYLKTLPK